MHAREPFRQHSVIAPACYGSSPASASTATRWPSAPRWRSRPRGMSGASAAAVARSLRPGRGRPTRSRPRGAARSAARDAGRSASTPCSHQRDQRALAHGVLRHQRAGSCSAADPARTGCSPTTGTTNAPPPKPPGCAIVRDPGSRSRSPSRRCGPAVRARARPRGGHVSWATADGGDTAPPSTVSTSSRRGPGGGPPGGQGRAEIAALATRLRRHRRGARGLFAETVHRRADRTGPRVPLERRFVDLGADAPAFPSIVAGGPNAAVPHHAPTERPLHRGPADGRLRRARRRLPRRLHPHGRARSLGDGSSRSTPPSRPPRPSAAPPRRRRDRRRRRRGLPRSRSPPPDYGARVRPRHRPRRGPRHPRGASGRQGVALLRSRPQRR